LRVIYLETSALLQWLLGQAGAAGVRQAVDQAGVVLTSALTRAEAERALYRAERQKWIREGDAQRLRGMLHKAERSWTRMAVSDPVLSRAGRSFPVEPVRTLDAIHLATALEFATAFPDLRILSFDHRVSENATALGIA
jgi:predicted nucleic acid-binding protein